MEIILIWLVFGIIFGIIGAMIGSSKGEGCFGFLICVLLGPLGLLIVIFMKGVRKTCPYCKELIHKDAMVCPKCQRDMPTPEKENGQKTKKQLD